MPPSYHLIVSGTATDALLLIQWYAGRGGEDELRFGEQQPLVVLLMILYYCLFFCD